MQSRHTAGLAGLMVLLALTACGGGGADGDASPSTPPPVTPAPVTPTPTVPISSTNVTLSGQVTFDFVPVAVSSGQPRLNYAATARRPARSVVVQALDVSSRAVVASTSTDANGSYVLAVPPNRNLQMRANARIQAIGSTIANFSVIDNTSGGAQWAIDGNPFNSGAANRVLSQPLMNAGSGWTGVAYNNAQRAAGPFAILDTVYSSAQTIIAVDRSISFPALSINWSPNNIAASGSLAAGQIGSSFFTTSGTGTRDLFILGAANNDTDEYDAHVVSHEFGHYLQDAFSRDDSIGGPHGGFNDRLDMRVAFSEGWGNAYSAIVLNNPVYADTNGSGQSTGFSFNVAAGEATNPGWFKEDSVQKVIWDLRGAPGFNEIWRVMRSGLTATSALTSIHAFASALQANNPSSQTTIRNALNNQAIALTTAFGDAETNFGAPEIERIRPIYLAYGPLNSNLNACVTSAADSLRIGNKAGAFRYLRMSFPSTGNRTFRVTHQSSTTGTTDPDFRVYGRNGEVLRGEGTMVNTETNSASNLAAGDYVMAVTDFNLTNDGRALNNFACFTVNVQ